MKAYGRKLDLVFAKAGVAQLASFGTVDEKFYDLHFDANVKGLFFTVQKSLSLSNDGASIILIASIADIKGSQASAFIAPPRQPFAPSRARGPMNSANAVFA